MHWNNKLLLGAAIAVLAGTRAGAGALCLAHSASVNTAVKSQKLLTSNTASLECL